jgi:hypothetical protein
MFPIEIDEWDAVLPRMHRVLGASFDTASRTVLAELFLEHHALANLLPLWIGAPFTAKGTPVHEDQGSCPWTVVNGVSLYVEYEPFVRSFC